MTGEDPARALEHAVAHGALAMMTPGDPSMATLGEVEALIRSDAPRIAGQRRSGRTPTYSSIRSAYGKNALEEVAQMSNSKVGVGIAGLGLVAPSHAMGYKRLPDLAEIRGVCDVDPIRAKAFAEEFGGNAYTNLDDLIGDPSIDAIDIALPHGLHYEAAMAVLGAGKHLLIEKPLAPTYRESVDICRKAEDGEFPSWYWPAVFLITNLPVMWRRPRFVSRRTDACATVIPCHPTCRSGHATLGVMSRRADPARIDGAATPSGMA